MFTTCQTLFKPTGGIISHLANWAVSNMGDCKHIHKDGEYKENKDQEIVIYCIHGTADRNASFTKLTSRLLSIVPAQVTCINLLSFEYRARGKSIEFFAEQLKNKIKANNHKNIIIMGHSRGGLIASYFAENMAREINVNVLEIICISSPFGGSPVALFPLTYLSDSVRQMQVNSPFLNELNEKIKKSSIKYLYFAGTHDRLVSCEQACIKDEKHKQSLMILDHHNHLSIMRSARLALRIKNSIDEIVDQAITEVEQKTNNRFPLSTKIN